MKGGAKVVVEGHRHAGIFIARGKEDALVTRNMAPGESVYGEKRVSVEQVGPGAAAGAWHQPVCRRTHRQSGAAACVPAPESLAASAPPQPARHGSLPTCPPHARLQEGGEKIEYRVWNPFRSKLAAAVLAGVDNIHIKPGARVLYLGAASGTSVSHVSDVVGPEGCVYAVEFSHRR